MQFRTALPSEFSVEVSTRTWARETHNLYDFEAEDSTVTGQNFAVREPTLFVRNANSVVVSNTEQVGDKLLQLGYDGSKSKFLLQRPRWSNQDERRVQRCWHLIRGGNSGHRLSEGDIIKFGRSQFKVRQLRINDQGDATLDIDSSACHVDPKEFETEQDHVCRICLMEGSTEDDPLLAPCKCKGSVKHVHLSCLRHWVKDRLGLANGDAPFVYNHLSCELCKTAYSTKIQIGQQTIPLIEVSSSFAVLESVSDGRLSVLPFVDGKSIKVGRGHDCDMNIHDTSISRMQAIIEQREDHFVLTDKESRFGTYVKITKPWSLDVDKEVTVQVGRTLLTLTAKKIHDIASADEFMTPASSVQGDVDTDNTEAQTPRIDDCLPSCSQDELASESRPISSRDGLSDESCVLRQHSNGL
jgi:pSer/pThr/pTyr-binding forkhead associated (FHA) protein